MQVYYEQVNCFCREVYWTFTPRDYTVTLDIPVSQWNLRSAALDLTAYTFDHPNDVFAMYDGRGKMLLCEHAEYKSGKNIVPSLALNDEAASYKAFFLNGESVPVCLPMADDISGVCR